MTAPVARLSSPADLVAVVPHLVGFVPEESLVLLALRGRRRRVRLTMRVDLPASRHVPLVAQDLVDRAVEVGASAVAVLVYTAQDGALPGEQVADVVLDACDAAGLDVSEALGVRDGRFWSFTCSGPCCPAEGTPVPEQPSDAVGLVQAERVLSGREVLPDRAALEASLARPDDPALTAAFHAAELEQPSHAERLARVRSAVEAWPRLWPFAPHEAADLALALDDTHVRDQVATWALDDPDRLQALLRQLCRQTPAPWDAAVCTVLAWVACATGDGGTANIALDRALETEPGYALALLLRRLVDAMLPPEEVRDLLRQVPTTGSGRPGVLRPGPSRRRS